MWLSKDDFSMDWGESGQSAADRHQIEQQNNLAERMKVAIQDIDANNYPETRRQLDDLLGRLTWNPTTVPPRERDISDAQFQTEFTNIMKQSWKKFDKTRPWTATSTNWRSISEIIKSNNIDQLSTNILMQANKFRTQQRMTRNIVDHINNNPAESSNDFDKYCRWEIQKFVNEFNDMPDFLQQMWLSLDKTDDIKTLKWHMWALSAIQAQSLKLRIQLLDDGWEAYNVKKTWWVLTKIWRFLDDPTWWENTKFGRWMNKHQNLKEAFGRVWWATKIGVMMTPSLLLAPVWPLAVAGWVGWMSLLTTLFKKPSHYEKEHRSYQRMQATNLEDYRARREELANEVAWMKWYEWRFWWFRKKTREKKMIRDQYRDYVQATQDQLLLSQDLVSRITKRLNSQNSLSWIERTNLAAYVADWLARLDYHKKTGQNFLWSNNPSVAEKEYRDLQNAVMWWAKRLGLVDAKWNPDMDQIRKNSPYDAYYTNTIDIIENWSWDEYNNQWYLKARKRYKTRRALKTADGALKAWAISFGLSYLASSLASHNRTRTIETDTNMHNWQVWWEYNLWDAQEHLFVTWDVNPTMNSVITPDTQSITWATIYSSVDSVPCSARKWALELAKANSDLTATLSSSPFSGNTAWIDAKTNFINEATAKIWAIPWVSEWNRQLALARAIEWRNEWILKPAIAAQAGKPATASLIWIDPSAIHWIDGWMQATSTGVVWQSFRNMWLVWIDYVQHWTEKVVEHVTRAIPIPRGINTFWESKKWWDWKHRSDTPHGWPEPEDPDEPDGQDWEWKWPNEWWEKWPESWGTKGPDIILPPVDPNDPAWPVDEKKPREKIPWKVKWVVTRWHETYTDKGDLWDEYPWSWEMLNSHDSALLLFIRWRNTDLECFTEDDINALRQLEWNDDAQIKYLESKIIEDRNIINDAEHNETMREFNDSMETSKKWIREFLPQIVWDIDSRLLNKFLADKRIHVVSDREYIGVIGDSRRSSWLFRGESWDLYIRYSYIQEHENDRIYSADWRDRWGWLDRHRVLIHEMLHSMSTMNYIVSEEDGKQKYDRRRVWLQQFRYDTNGKYLWETWRSMNEAATESLWWEICRRWFNSIGLDLTPYRESSISYKHFIDVIDQLREIDNIDNKDFWKAMLIRKRAKGKPVEWKTPLTELMLKVDWRYEENWKIRYSRPNYYNLISNCMDFAGKNGSYNTKWIVDFITKKDINILKNYVRSQGKTLKDVFDNDLLDWSDFKAEILNAYKG